MPIPVLLSILVASTARSQIERNSPCGPDHVVKTDAASSRGESTHDPSDGASKSPRGKSLSRGVLSE
jgi:hypothetical protein